MKRLPDKEYKSIKFKRYNKNKYSLIINGEYDYQEVMLDNMEAKKLCGRMLMLIEGKTIKETKDKGQNGITK